MWQQNYTPLVQSVGLSALIAAIPVFVMLLMMGPLRMPAWKSSLASLGAAVLVALFVYRMPVPLLASTVVYGGSFGLFPIGWIVLSAILLYNITLHTGKFEIVKHSIAGITDDRRLQALIFDHLAQLHDHSVGIV